MTQHPFHSFDDDAPATHPNGEPRPASTIVLLADREGRAPDILMIERAKGMAFAGGALAFPGGAVDEADVIFAQKILPHGMGINDAASRLAAIRETIEEVGIGVGFDARLSEELSEMRAALHAGATLAEIAEQHGLVFDLHQLVPMARWLPPDIATHRIYDTRFYAVRLDEAHDHALPDGSETVRIIRDSASSYLGQSQRGEVSLLLPTLRCLERMAQFDSVDAILADLRAYPLPVIKAEMVERDGVPHLSIPDDLGYPVTSAPFRPLQRP